MSLKELLLSRKAGFIKYMVAALFPIINSLSMSLLMALLLGLIQDITYFKEVVFIAGLIAVFNVLLQVLSRKMRIGYMRDVLMDIRYLAFDRIIDKSYQQFAAESKDVYLSNLVNDINLFEQDFFVSILNVIVNIGTFVFSLIILFFLDPTIGVLTLLVSSFMAFISSKFERRTTRLKHEVSTANEEFSVYAANTLSGLEILKLNQVEDRFQLNFFQRVLNVEKLKQSFNLFKETQHVTLETIGYIFTMGVTILISFRLAQGESFTQVAFMIQIVNQIVWNLVYTFPHVNTAKASHSIYEKITRKDPIDDSQSGELPFSLQDEIKVKHVSFNYPDEPETEVLSKLNMSLEKGKKYLLKGASGAGKTTFLQLLSKVFTPTSGTIEIDGINLSDISTLSFNEHVAFIYQSVFLFNDTIRNNITLFDENITEEQLNDAINKSGLREFIDKLPDGVNTLLEENGKNISGGERQRISIARALVKEAEILFVDEATSSLDSALGEAIEKTLLELDETVIAISHRTYPGVTEKYDGVISINNKQAYLYDTKDYLELGGITS